MEIAASNAAAIAFARAPLDSASAVPRTRVSGESAASESERDRRVQEPSRSAGPTEPSAQAAAPLSTSGDVRAYLVTGPQQRVQAEAPQAARPREPDGERPPADATGIGEPEAESEATASLELTESEQQEVQELQQRDREVRQHEQAHLAAAGSLATGGAQYQFQTGPDGKAYAIGGSVNIDTSPANTPERTLEKAKQIQRAAMAPADPSPQDVKVAAKAMQMQMEAQREIAEQAGDSHDKDSEPEPIRNAEAAVSAQESTLRAR